MTGTSHLRLKMDGDAAHPAQRRHRPETDQADVYCSVTRLRLSDDTRSISLLYGSKPAS